MVDVPGSRELRAPSGTQAKLDFRDREALAAWIRSLSTSDHRGTAKLIQKALRQALTESIPLRQLFEFLELLGPPAAGVLEGLRKSYAEVRFPLPERVKGAAEQADDLCELLILGYQKVLKEIHSSSIADENSPFAGLWQIVAHRILYYSFGIVQRAGLLSSEGRNNLWLRVNRIYFTAAGERLSAHRVAFEGVADYPVCTVDHLYKRLLLISLVPLHALRTQQLEELLASLDLWAEQLATRICGPDRDRSRMPFQIEPSNDQGPCYTSDACKTCENGRCMLLDTGRLLKQIHQLILKGLPKHEQRVLLENDLFVSVSTLEVLRRSWGERPPREDERIPVPITEEIEMIVSVEALYSALTPTTDESPNASAEEATHHAQAPVFDRVAIESHGLNNYGNHPMEEKSAWDERRHKSSAKFHQVQVRDMSSNGLGLEVTVQPEMRLRVGDLVGLRGLASDPLLLAVVRWLRQSGSDRLDCGVLVLADQVHPVQLTADQGEAGGEQGGSTVPCLLAVHRRTGKTVLTLDYFPVIRNKLFVLAMGKVKLPIAFTNWPLEDSRAFEAFEFTRRHGTENRPEPDEPRLTLEELLMMEEG